MQNKEIVKTELAHSFKRLSGSWRFRIGAAALLLLILVSVVVHRFSPKTTVEDCAFRISTAALPEIKGDAFRVDTCVELDVASTNSARTLGLSGRKTMPQTHGMLFDFVVAAEYCMWMKDMHFGLDMIWLNEQKEIVYMIEGVTPDTYPKSFCGPGTARYVVEVNQGIVKAGDLHVGQHLNF